MSVGVAVSTVIAPQAVSTVGSNPMPVIVTTILAGPEVGLTVIVGPVAVNVAKAWSPVAP